ncbi:hypothetical protein HK098_004754 [Nowakowskiella sp. JEL0407]|nr:hypothetical protein HK098_004754 [Nowakowskiella sp. JEL0407]
MKYKLIWLCRHAQAEHNVSGNLSIADPLLTPLGKEQAALLPQRIRELSSSPVIQSLMSSKRKSPTAETAPDIKQYQSKIQEKNRSLHIDLVMVSPMRRTIETAFLGFSGKLDFVTNNWAFSTASDANYVVEDEAGNVTEEMHQTQIKSNRFKIENGKLTINQNQQVSQSFSTPNEKMKFTEVVENMEVLKVDRSVENVPMYDGAKIRTMLVPDLQEITNFPADVGSSMSSLQSHFPFLSPDPSHPTPDVSVEGLLPENWYIKRKRDLLPAAISLRIQRLKRQIWEMEEQSIFMVSHGGFLKAFINGTWNMYIGMVMPGWTEGWKNTEVRVYKMSLQQWEAILSKQQPSPSAYVNATSSVVSVTDEDFITNESIPQTAQRVSPAVAFGIKRLKQISFPTPLLSQYNAQLHSESSDEISQLKQDSKSFLEMLNSTSSPTRKRNILPYNLTYGPRETKAYLSTRFPVAYAVIRGILEELYNRLPPTQEIKSIVDFGSKCGATVIAAEEVWKTEKNYRLIEESPSMQKQIQQFTSDEQIFSTSSKLKFHAKLDVDEIKRADLVVANFSIQELPEKIRRQHVLKLWDLVYENNGILVVVERGTVFGASVIQQTREWILEKIKTGSSEGFILAPCAHEEVCPMMSALKLNERLKQEIEKKEKMDGKKSNLVDEDSLWVDDSDEVVEKKEEKREKKTAAVTKGKMKAWCHFPQKVQLPSATMKILGLKDNTLETTYSYIIFQKGKRPPGSESEDFHGKEEATASRSAI